MPLSTFKNSKTFQSKQILSNFKTKFKIYGLKWSIVFVIIAIKRFFINNLILKSYSQYGEDLYVDKLLNKKKNIVYIDVGSNHPQKFNNTYRFYKRGGNGVVVEPNKELISLHKLKRPNDICLNVGLSNTNTTRMFYELFPDVASTFSSAEYQSRIKTGAKLIRKTKVKTVTLINIFDKYLTNQNVDFLSVDTEGHDLEVLSGNNWKKHRPKIICVESLDKNGVHQYLTEQKYKLVYKNIINSIYETIA